MGHVSTCFYDKIKCIIALSGVSKNKFKNVALILLGDLKRLESLLNFVGNMADVFEC